MCQDRKPLVAVPEMPKDLKECVKSEGIEEGYQDEDAVTEEFLKAYLNSQGWMILQSYRHYVLMG